MHHPACLASAVVLAACVAACQADRAPRVLKAEAFGVPGDGVADAGPAIERLMAAAGATRGPVRVQFQPRRTYYVGTAPQRYVFRLRRASQLTLDGGGSTFALAPHLRFMALHESSHITVRRLRVDFRPLPFADGTVVAVDAAQRRLRVKLADWVEKAPLGGPTGEDGEQAFFSMLWFAGPYGTLSQHYWTQRISSGPEPGTVDVYAAPDYQGFEQVKAGQWRISLPVPGVAHRFGPGPCFEIADNDTVSFEDVELWSAPWMGFLVARNRGELVFRRVNVRPRPGTGRLTSTWRDGFHVKGNRASLLWEGCVLCGMNDDAFNISTHSSVVSRVVSPTEIEVSQKFPLLPIRWAPGALLTAVDEPAARLLGTARVVEAKAGPAPPPIQGQEAAPVYSLRLDRAVPGLGQGAMVWDPAWCNPDTTLRRCRISMSCRLQSPVRLEKCDVNALLWFYCEHIEGAFPRHVALVDCRLRRGRGNPTLAVAFSGAPTAEARSPDRAARPRAIHDVVLQGNEVWGSLQIEGVERLRVQGNRFLEPGAAVTLRGNYDCQIEGNRDAAGRPWPWPTSGP